MIHCLFLRDKLVAYAEELLDTTEQDYVERHLKECGRCRRKIEELRLICNSSVPSVSVPLDKKFWITFDRELDMRLREAPAGQPAESARRVLISRRRHRPLTLAFAGAAMIALVIAMPFVRQIVPVAVSDKEIIKTSLILDSLDEQSWQEDDEILEEAVLLLSLGKG